METKTFEVPNIGCAGCVQAIKLELQDLAGLSQVEGDVASRRIEVQYAPPATWAAIVAALQDIGYPPATD